MQRNRALLDWYDRHGRDLPWRRTSDPWAILVSEVMLQQTQVRRVVPAYESFLRLYPEPSALATVPVAAAITAWGDLGYLRRVVRLHAAARLIHEEGWPSDLEELPGVGRYTAASVSAFAYGRRTAAVDVNLRRILSRWTGRLLGPREAEAIANDLVDPERPGDWNQSMMDLGATVCVARAPRCHVCPVATDCADPTLGLPSRRQPRFAGSVREARAAVLKSLAAGVDALAEPAVAALDPTTVAAAVEGLVADGIVERNGARLRLR